MEKIKNPLIIIFLLALFTVPLTGMIQTDYDVSTAENRALQMLPEISIGSVKELTSELDSYVVDQFPFRDAFVKLYTGLQMLGNKIQIRNVYMLDDWMLTRDYNLNKSDLAALSASLEKTIENNPDTDFYYVIFPSKTAMLADFYPQYIDPKISLGNNEALKESLGEIKNLRNINLLDRMLDETSPSERLSYYYKTDFHWNGVGSFRTFEMLIDQLEGNKSLAEAKSKIKTIQLQDKYFTGDLERRFSGMVTNNNIPDVNLLVETESLAYYRSVDDSYPVERSEIIAPNIDNGTVGYNDIYTFNLSCIRIENQNSVADKKALIIKDSYFNAMVDPISSVFRELTIIDPRYYSENYTFAEILEILDPDYILFCYHQSHVDKTLVELLNNE